MTTPQFPVVFIAGARGWGKSTLARELTRGQRRRIVLDPMRDWAKHGSRPISKLSEVSSAIAQNWSRGFDISFAPPPGFDHEALHRLSLMLMGYTKERGLYRGRQNDEVMLVVDEMAHAYTNAHAQSKDLTGFKIVVSEGRHCGISIVGLSQLPADVSTQFRGNAEAFYAFQVHSDAARGAVLDRLGKANAAAFDALGRYEYLCKRDGVVTKGKTRK